MSHAPVAHETITIETIDGPMRAHVATPVPSSLSSSSSSSSRFPAVVVAQEAFGVNAHIESVCARLAAAGFVAIAPELFHRRGDGITVPYTDMTAVMAALSQMTNADLLTDLRATVAAAKARDDVDAARVSLIGFCVGGFAVFLAATKLDVASTVSCYGGGLVRERPGIGLSPIVEQAAAIRAPLLCVFGADDKSIPMTDVDVVRSGLQASSNRHAVRIVPGAGHGFLCDARASYVARAADETWPVLIDWLQHASAR